MKQEVYLTTFELMHTYGFWAIMKWILIPSSIIAFLTIKGLRYLTLGGE